MALPENRPNRTATGKFTKGSSGNPGGRPKGAKTVAFNIRQLVGEALAKPEIHQQAVERVRENLIARKTVLPHLEFAARLNREIGIGSEQVTAGVTFVFSSNLRPEALRRHKGPL
jgi:Family of unknown function (DUF5681)